MPEKYTLKNITDRDLTFVRPVNLRMKPGEEKTVFLSDPQASCFRQNPGEVELLRVLPPPAPGQEISLADVKVEVDGAEVEGEIAETDGEPQPGEAILSDEVEKEEPPDKGTKKGRR